MSLIGAEPSTGRKRTGTSEQHHVPHAPQHKVQRQHRGPRGRDSGVLPRRKGAGLSGPPGPLRAHLAKCANHRQGHRGPVGARQQAEIVYLQKRPSTASTEQAALPFRDAEFGMVNLRVFGEFRYKVGARRTSLISSWVPSTSPPPPRWRNASRADGGADLQRHGELKNKGMEWPT